MQSGNQQEQLQIPVLLMGFNRPENTKKVIESIRQAKPTRVYVSCDGPREGRQDDAEKVTAVKEVVRQGIDWECELFTRYSEVNLSCGVAVSSAINWFFENEEMGIVLEDDIYLEPSFYWFAQQMLQQYLHDDRVMMIAALNVLNGWHTEEQDYHFALYGGCWGWATWRRAWKYFDFSMEKWTDPLIRARVREHMGEDFQYAVRAPVYDKLVDSIGHGWDYAWTFARLINNGLTIVPAKNTVTNLGFGADSTHTFEVPAALKDLKPNALNLPARTNHLMLPDREYDRRFTLALNPGADQSNQQRSLARKVVDKLKRI